MYFTRSGKIKISTSDPVCAVQITAIDQILNTPVKANIIWEGFTSRFLLFDIPTNVHLADVAIELKNSNDLDIVESIRFVKPNSRQEASPFLITIFGINTPEWLLEYEILILRIVNNTSFHLINLYASRGLNITLLNSFLESSSDPVFIFGDFNLHHPIWSSNHTSPYSEIFVEWLTNSNFILLNTDVLTHRSNVGSGALLDFTLCSSNLIGYSNTFVSDSSYNSDHCPVITDFNIHNPIKRTINKLDWRSNSRLNRFVEWAQNEIAVVPDFHKRILFSDEAHFWLNGYVNKQNCRIWSEANPQVYVETPLHPEKLTVWCALWAGGILLQKR
ncbi:RNA-directed DNA polymerase from mobile element jockey [Trichonephila clavipes]|uniref:RNA-directed DNA polymerase from mobile element jockey n=1 Tax=Trichonephila clavipes TaxID=2585209 RepID=A0A8X6SM07_TRICX|nr:RNA-directed DNA polymerase from mobile element jockey [Trichonephila clavipes]